MKIKIKYWTNYNLSGPPALVSDGQMWIRKYKSYWTLNISDDNYYLSYTSYYGFYANAKRNFLSNKQNGETCVYIKKQYLDEGLKMGPKQ